MRAAQPAPQDVTEHPAVVAWNALHPGCGAPTTVEVLKQEGAGTGVYRLLGVGRGSSVIAKRCRQETARVERLVYECVLPRLASPVPGHYGSLDDGDAAWLFLEEVCGEPYRPHDPAHRVAAARWLAQLHSSACGIPEAARLPDRGPAHYRRLLSASCAAIGSQLTNPAIGARELPTLEALLAHLERLSAHWSELEHSCDGVPWTLVHGDFVAHNVYMRSGRSGLVVVPIDWEKAGWGTPAEDISSVDLAAYWRAVRHRWPGPRREAFEAVARAGRFFRCLVFLDWVIPRLEREGVDEPLRDLGLCRSWLDELIPGAGW